MPSRPSARARRRLGKLRRGECELCSHPYAYAGRCECCLQRAKLRWERAGRPKGDRWGSRFDAYLAEACKPLRDKEAMVERGEYESVIWGRTPCPGTTSQREQRWDPGETGAGKGSRGAGPRVLSRRLVKVPLVRRPREGWRKRGEWFPIEMTVLEE